MFQFTYKLKITERVKANANATRAIIQSAMGAAAFAAPAPHASRSSICSRPGLRSKPRSASFSDEPRHGAASLSRAVRRGQQRRSGLRSSVRRSSRWAALAARLSTRPPPAGAQGPFPSPANPSLGSNYVARKVPHGLD
jgi:hypothetical protein